MVAPPSLQPAPVVWRGHGRSWVTRLGHFPTMKNLARLVQFAWPYRVRFVLSLGCAVMVALLYMADIASVYPLLKILFYNENCQKWVAEKIVGLETEIRTIDVRRAEDAFVRKVGQVNSPLLRI